MRIFSGLLHACLLAFAVNSLMAQEVLSKTLHEFSLQGLTVLEVRTLDPEAAVIHQVARTRDGVLVNVDDLTRREEELRAAHFQKMSPDLLARVLGADPVTAPIEVALWMRIAGLPDFHLVLEEARARGMTGEDARCVARDVAEQFIRPHTRGLSLELAACGHEITYAGTCWPVVIAKIPAGEIAGVAADPRVAMAYHSASGWATENHNAQPTLRTPTVHARGNTGKNSTIKVMVNDPGHVTTQNPYLPPVTLLNSGSAASHATACGGNICSHHTTYFGGARELPQLFSGNGSGDTNAPKVWDLAIKAGICYGNCSWWNGKKGKIEFLDRFFDYTIRNFGVMMFKSSGNQGNTSTPYSTTPGNGYNMTNSGCYNDGDSWDWANDQMASYSSYLNPAEGHEKPEVASPGDKVTSMYYRDPWIYNNFGGTSSASPLTCGVATLLGSRDANLRTRTYTLKAILMASAWHNVEGAALLSDKDGAGGVHAGAADAVVRDKQFVDGTLTASSFPGGQKDIPVQLQAGDETRIVALWFSNASSTYSTDVLDMDLDMMILDPASKVVASSASTRNPFEIASFIPPVTGTYTVRLQRQRFNGSTEPYAVVWSTRQDMATAEVTLAGSGKIGTTMTVNFMDQYHPGAGYMGAASFGSLPGYVSLPEGHIVPLGADPLFFASALGMYPGFSGTLDASGKAAGTLAIPDLSALRGIRIYLGMFSYRSGTGNYVKGTSPAATFLIQ